MAIRLEKLTKTDALLISRLIPRSARLAQGYSRVEDFAEAMLAKCEFRRKLRRKTDSIELNRRRLAELLQPALDASPELRRAARRNARLHPRDTYPYVRVVGNRETECEERGHGFIKYNYTIRSKGGDEHTLTHYTPSNRYVAAPIAWVLARLRERASYTGPMTRSAVEQMVGQIAGASDTATKAAA